MQMPVLRTEHRSRRPRLSNHLYTAAATLLTLLTLVTQGCERAPQPEVASPSERAPSATTAQAAPGGEGQAPQALAQVIARSAALPARPARIVSLAPNLTEILFALGAGERVVGVTRYCDYPVQVSALPKIGGYMDADLEAVLTTRPELVLGMAADQDAALAARLASAGLQYAFLRMDTIEEVARGMESVGALIGDAKAGARAAQTLRRDMAPATDLPSPAPRVVFALGHDPLVVAGPGTFADELITLAGGVNAIGASSTAYPVIDQEQLTTLRPDVLLDASMTPGQPREASPWRGAPGLAQTAVVALDATALLRPGPRLSQARAIMTGAIRAPREPHDAP